VGDAVFTVEKPAFDWAVGVRAGISDEIHGGWAFEMVVLGPCARGRQRCWDEMEGKAELTLALLWSVRWLIPQEMKCRGLVRSNSCVQQ